jgi:hypothetical protein
MKFSAYMAVSFIIVFNVFGTTLSVYCMFCMLLFDAIEYVFYFYVYVFLFLCLGILL